MPNGPDVQTPARLSAKNVMYVWRLIILALAIVGLLAVAFVSPFVRNIWADTVAVLVIGYLAVFLVINLRKPSA
jgi:hypothetical protein